jgi:hypothetical protein
MGKRELLLVVVFIVVGVIVYQVTAPPPRPGQSGLSISRILAGARRALHGNRGRAEVTHSTSYSLTPSTTEIRVSGPMAAVHVIGEDRPDVACDFQVNSTGFDDAEAKRLADQSVVQIENAGASSNLQVIYPIEGSQTGVVTLKVPARLLVRIEETRSRASVVNVASAELVSSRGETTLRQIAGRVALTHRGGRVVIEDVGSLKFVARAGADVSVTRVRGDVSLDLQGGQLKASDVTGAIDVESRSAEIRVKADRAQGHIRVNAVGGSITMENVKTELRVDGRNADVNVTIAEGAPSIAIYGVGGADIHVTPPSGGYHLDAIAMNGRVTLPDNTLTVATNSGEQRANGAVKGGGPTITLRSRAGDIVVRGR